MPASLGYYKIRGLAQHIRYLLEYTGEDYVDTFYKFGPPPEYSRSHWYDQKFKLGLDFPNVPYYIDGDFKLTQSTAIFRYIAAKHGLLGQTDVERAKADMLVNEAFDLRVDFAKFCNNPDFEKEKNDYISQKIKPKLTQFSQFIGNNDWFLGNKITYADFIIYELLAYLIYLSAETFNEFENLKHFLKRFEALKPIKTYMNSERHVNNYKHLFGGPAAYFGGK